jgi:hypothetical protein
MSSGRGRLVRRVDNATVGLTQSLTLQRASAYLLSPLNSQPRTLAKPLRRSALPAHGHRQRRTLAAKSRAATGEGGGDDKTTVADYLRGWLDADTDLSPKTRESYRQLVDHQISRTLARRRCKAFARRRSASGMRCCCAPMASAGGYCPRALSVTRTASCTAVLSAPWSLEMVARNVAYAIRSPKVVDIEIASLTAEQIGDVLARLPCGSTPINLPRPMLRLPRRSNARCERANRLGPRSDWVQVGSQVEFVL